MEYVTVDPYSWGNATHNDTNGTATWEIVVFASTGTFAGISVLVTAILLYGHLRYWSLPEQQTLIARILIMAPVYSVDSWLSIQFREYALYFDLVRDCYEAYALYCFFALLVKYIESSQDGTPADEILQKEPVHPHLLILRCLPPVKPGAVYLLWTKRLILQYTLVKPVCTLIAIILNIFGKYNEGKFDPAYGYVYIIVLVNISVGVSLYPLLLFYMVGYPFFKPYKPLLKFLAIKAVVFFSFWQNVIISVLSALKVIPHIGDWDEEHVGTGINNLLICIEMFILSILNYHIFPYSVYKPEFKQAPQPAGKVFTSAVKNFTDVMDQSDIVGDIKTSFSKKGAEEAREKHHKWKEDSALLAKEDENMVDLDVSERSQTY